ncbi:VOC family protein [Paenarthrobacter sp. NPDC058040]|uniref:VOC family protein n=1 Tax=unclassified Paenarthrobacter TaxID=2634190 RepID=UPI0036D92DEA
METVLFVGKNYSATRMFFDLIMNLRPTDSGSQPRVLFAPPVETATPDSGVWVPCFGSTNTTGLRRQVLGFGAELVSNLIVDGRELHLYAAPDDGLFALTDLAEVKPQPELPGAVAFVDLYTPEAAKAASYYANALSCRVIHETIPTPGDYRFLVSGQEPVAGIVDMLDVLPTVVAPHWIPYWRVVDMEAEVARLSDLGARVRVPVTDSALGPFALLADPFGVTFGLQTPLSDNLLVEHGKVQTGM